MESHMDKIIPYCTIRWFIIKMKTVYEGVILKQAISSDLDECQTALSGTLKRTVFLPEHKIRCFHAH
jgi:hypothetical protein